MKHSKGPWGWWPNCCREGGMVTTNDGGGHVAAPTHYENHPEITAANARLIAAAPELLEALEEVRDDFGQFGNGGVSNITIEKVLAAIAKAKGE